MHLEILIVAKLIVWFDFNTLHVYIHTSRSIYNIKKTNLNMNNRENLISSIKKLGWHLTNEAVDELINENNNLKQNDLIKIALDVSYY